MKVKKIVFISLFFLAACSSNNGSESFIYHDSSLADNASDFESSVTNNDNSLILSNISETNQGSDLSDTTSDKENKTSSNEENSSTVNSDSSNFDSGWLPDHKPKK